MTDSAFGPLVDTQWLAENIGRADVKVIDSSFYLPTENRDNGAEFLAGHIPGAVFFDIDEIADKSTSLPHMFPSESKFAEAVGGLGIASGDTVIAYDGGKLTGACRAWWMFRAFGHGDIAVLDGGIGKWRAEGRDIEAGPANPTPAAFEARFDAVMVRSMNDVLAAIDAGDPQILDARAAGRFDGTAPEPRPGMRSGHMPGAYNLPYDRLLRDDGTVRTTEEISALFAEAGIDLGRPVITSCGSGVSAAVLLLGLDLIGHDKGTLYDGSWSEWGSRDDTPIVT
jgi:thiosulfate/3-mercaptopyruvate sulfurtransferase